MSGVSNESPEGDLFRKSMEDALAHLDKVNGDLKKAHEEAVEREIQAREELAKILRDADRLAAEQIDKRSKEHDRQLRDDIMLEVTRKLVLAGRSAFEIMSWLEIRPEMMGEVWFDLGFEALRDRPAHVIYEGNAIAGHAIFYWDGIKVHFPYEFRSRASFAAMIHIPIPVEWESRTGIAFADRDLVLEFLANRFIRDVAFDKAFTIQSDHIRFY